VLCIYMHSTEFVSSAFRKICIDDLIVLPAYVFDDISFFIIV